MKIALPIVALLLGGAALPLSGSNTSSDEFIYDGVAQPSRLVQLGAATDGLIAEVLAERGDVVRAQQVVARLDVAVDEAEARLANARSEASASREVAAARIADAERRLKNQESLLAEGFIKPEEVNETRTELRIEQLNLAKVTEDMRINVLERERADAIVAQGTIRSPIDGVVFERFLSAGEILSRSGQSEVMTIAQLDPLYIEVHVSVDLLRSIEVGQSAMVELDMPSTPRRAAVVQVKDQLVNTASRTFRVRLELPNPDYRFPAGLRCRVSFDD